jgi:hypothetical protein
MRVHSRRAAFALSARLRGAPFIDAKDEPVSSRPIREASPARTPQVAVLAGYHPTRSANLVLGNRGEAPADPFNTYRDTIGAIDRSSFACIAGDDIGIPTVDFHGCR